GIASIKKKKKREREREKWAREILAQNQLQFVFTREVKFDKKQIRVIFLFEFKMGHKAAEATLCCNINNIFGPGTAKEQTVQWWIKKLWKGHKVSEDEKYHGWLLEVDNDQLRGSSKLILLQQTTQEVVKQLSINHSIFIWHLKQIGKVKKLYKWVPHELTTDQNKQTKIIVLKCSLKYFPEPNLHQKKDMVNVWWSAAGLIHYSFLNPGKTITPERYAQQIYEIHRKLQLSIFLYDNGWPHITQLMLQKLNEVGYEVLSHPTYSPDLLSPYYHYFKHLNSFFQENCFHKTEAENAFQEFLEG
ncbi:hypothetical protein FD754_023551, partial [Muntiacus muntjak]